MKVPYQHARYAAAHAAQLQRLPCADELAYYSPKDDSPYAKCKRELREHPDHFPGAGPGGIIDIDKTQAILEGAHARALFDHAVVEGIEHGYSYVP